MIKDYNLPGFGGGFSRSLTTRVWQLFYELFWPVGFQMEYHPAWKDCL